MKRWKDLVVIAAAAAALAVGSVSAQAAVSGVDRREARQRARIERGIRWPLKEAAGDTIADAHPRHAGANRRDVARPVRQRDQVACIRSGEIRAARHQLVAIVERRGAHTDEHLPWPR